MNDLSKQLRRCKTGCMAGALVVNIRMYADDCVVISPSSAALQQLLSVCSKYEELHDVKYDDAQSVTMISRTNEDKRLVFPDLKLSVQVLNTCRQVKYLGHVITGALTDDEDIFRQCCTLYVQANILH